MLGCKPDIPDGSLEDNGGDIEVINGGDIQPRGRDKEIENLYAITVHNYHLMLHKPSIDMTVIGEIFEYTTLSLYTL